MVGFAICDLRSAIGSESASFAAALASKASPSRQAGQLPAGPSPESFAPHCGHVFTAGTSNSFTSPSCVTVQKFANGYTWRDGARDHSPSPPSDGGEGWGEEEVLPCC